MKLENNEGNMWRTAAYETTQHMGASKAAVKSIAQSNEMKIGKNISDNFERNLETKQGQRRHRNRINSN